MSNAFRDLGLKEEICTALDELGFETPSPIQEESIPELLNGHDVIGQAQTGTGKTAAFGLPLMQQIDPTDDATQAIVLTPTRELCIQVTQALRSYAEHLDINVVAVFGGAPVREQAARVRSNAHVVVATVGRMKDLISRHALVLTSARYVVLDEADEMLDLGFLEDVEKILRTCPSGRQTLLFSATMPGPIERLAETYMYDPVTIKITPKVLTVEAIEQAHVMVSKRDKTKRLQELLKVEQPEQAIIFCRTKIGTAQLDRDLRNAGLRCKALHGDLSQGQRDGVMISFKEHALPLLVATDVAARGLDIEHVTHVINFDMPNNTEIYVHRIGRTGRVGRTGRAITFVTPEQADDLKTIEREAKVQIGEWEAPEDRIEHAPKPRRRDHSKDRSKPRSESSSRDSDRRSRDSRSDSTGSEAKAEQAESVEAVSAVASNGSSAESEPAQEAVAEAPKLSPAEKLAALNLDELSPAARRDAEIKARALGVVLGGGSGGSGSDAPPAATGTATALADDPGDDGDDHSDDDHSDHRDEADDEQVDGPTDEHEGDLTDEQADEAEHDESDDHGSADREESDDHELEADGHDAVHEVLANEANSLDDATNIGVGRVDDDYDFGDGSGDDSSGDASESSSDSDRSRGRSDRGRSRGRRSRGGRSGGGRSESSNDSGSRSSGSDDSSSRSDDSSQRESAGPPESNEAHTRLFINRGARSEISEEDVRFSLVEGALIPGDAIVDIRVLERFTFVDVEGEHGEKALEMLDGTKIAGKQVRVEYANA